MNLDNDDKEYLQAILTAHQAKIEREIYMISVKLDTHIATEIKNDSELDDVKKDVETLKTKSSNHEYHRKRSWIYVIAASIIIGIATNLDKLGIF